MMLLPSRAVVAATASISLCATLTFAQVPTTRYVAVQDGPGATAQEMTTYMPGRLLIQINNDAFNRSSLRRDYTPVVPSVYEVTGIPALDMEMGFAGATGIRRALIETAQQELGRELGLNRWYMAYVNPNTDIEALAQRLRELPEIEHASPDYRAFPMDVPNDPLHSAHWGHNNTAQMLDYCWGCGGHPSGSPVGTVGFDTNAQAAWDAASGYGAASVVIAIIDSGVDAGHPDLRQVAGWDYGDGDSNADDNSSAPGHGTACAGVAAAIQNNGLGSAGIAGGASIMPLKVANSAGNMFFSAVANAIIHSADNGADIASLSLGAAISNDTTTSNAISYANSNGVTILAATGNENATSISYPANHALVIGVGAASPCGERKRSSSSSSEVNPGVSTDPNGWTCDGERWWGSNYGTNSQDAAGAVDVIAPTILPTTDIQGSGGYDSGDYSGYFNGTSCSTPYAAGVCALILTANPAFTPAQVRAQLVSTCQDVTSVESGAGWDRFTGYGMVDAEAAVGGGGTGPGDPDYATLPYATGFESGSLDNSWRTTEGAEGRIQVTSANGPFAGSQHLTMDDHTDAGAYSQNEAWLHLDLSGESEVDLSFQWKEFGDETHTEDGVYFSSNGGSSFTKVHSFDGGATTNDTWAQVNLDLDDLASGAGLSLSSTFVIKFQQYDNYAIATDGFAFDEISVAAGSTGGGGDYATLPYSTGFESGLDSFWATTQGAEGRIQVTSANGPFAGSQHLTMDDHTDGGAYSQNEAWLHLDLSGESAVTLDFQWKEFGDETHSQDGIFFSDNDGASFTKVYDLNGGSTTNNSWSAHSLNLSSLASGAGLSLSSTFVVKFQQYDNYAMTTDGFAFDEISVTAGGGSGGTRATVGYSTGFESGSLDSFWTATEGVEGRIQVTSANGPFAGSFHLTMDDDTDGGSFSQNEAWLLCDFTGESQVNLSFRWKELGDETHSQDGIYFSDNGGSSFTKVLDLNGGSTTNDTWQLINMDVDSLASGAGLSLNANFVIKFQQYDNYSMTLDGFCFDDVSLN